MSFSFLALGFGGGVAGGAPPTKYVGLALTNTIGPACGTAALQNIPYPAQVLTKSCKMVPVMIMGTIFYRKRYSAVEYLAVLLIISGSCAMSKCCFDVDVPCVPPLAGTLPHPMPPAGTRARTAVHTAVSCAASPAPHLVR